MTPLSGIVYELEFTYGVFELAGMAGVAVAVKVTLAPLQIAGSLGVTSKITSLKTTVMVSVLTSKHSEAEGLYKTIVVVPFAISLGPGTYVVLRSFSLLKSPSPSAIQ